MSLVAPVKPRLAKVYVELLSAAQTAVPLAEYFRNCPAEPPVGICLLPAAVLWLIVPVPVIVPPLMAPEVATEVTPLEVTKP